jgi:nucleoside-diphosphate-sugar epimerase/glycosyltransferase involved in cell wall biosynthesis
MSALEPYIRALRGPILVTGGSGFIGANLFKKILAVRPDVYAVEKRYRSWRLADVGDDNLLCVDLNDESATKNLVNSIAPQTVFSCVAYGAYSFEGDAALIYETNFNSIVRLTEMLAAKPFAAFVHAGSSSEYGTNCTAPPEDAVCLPNSDYAVSKLSTSSYLSYAGKSKSFPCINLRLYAVYGPLEDTSRLIPNVLRKALAGTLPPFVDPRTSRDFVHVDDVCAAFVMAAAKMNPGLYGEVVNIGSGTKTTIEELASLAKRLFAVDAAPEFGSMKGRQWDLSDWYADPRKAAKLLDWTPQVSLEDGLRTTAAWVGSLDDEIFNVTANKAMAKRKRSISAIVACYKDAPAIPLMYQRLTATFRKLGIDYELIFVNDCSPDDTAEIVRTLSEADTHVIGISHSRNFGSQMAFRSGMELATKDSVVLLDGDLQDPPELIEQFYEQWEAGFDVVYGRRVKRDMPLFLGLFYKLFYRVFAAFSYIKIPLDAGDFSLMDRRVVGWLLNCGERDLFMRGLRAYVGFAQTGVDYVRPERAFGRSTNDFSKNVEWAKKGIFAYSNTPLTMLTTAGVVCICVTGILILYQIVFRIFFPSLVPPGITTVLLAIMIFGSLNIFAVGLVGEYVAKIIIEVKGRPRLIRSALIRNGSSTELLPDGKERV